MIEQIQFPFQGKSSNSSVIINIAICIYLLILISAIFKRFSKVTVKTGVDGLDSVK